MENNPKNTVMTRNGTSVRMNDAALKMAMRHFGVNPQHTKNVPVEILQLPKRIDIIKADVKVQPAVKETPKEVEEEKKVEHDIVLNSIKKARKAPVRNKSTK